MSKSAIYRDDQYLYVLCYDVKNCIYGISMISIDTSSSYQYPINYYPLGWTTQYLAERGLRSYAFKLGLRRIKDDGRVAYRNTEDSCVRTTNRIDAPTIKIPKFA